MRSFISILMLLLCLQLDGAHAASMKSAALPDLATESLGTLDGSNGGLSEDMWYGSEGKTILSLVEALPSNTQSTAMKRLMAQLLLTKARPPAGLPESPSLFDLRMQHLMHLGRGKDLSEMVALLPEERRTEEVEKTQVAALLYSRNYGEACPKITEAMPRYESPFWQQANIICLSVVGKKSEAELAIKLLEESSGKPATLACCNIPYRRLVELIPPPANEPLKPLPPVKPGNLLEIPLLIAAGFTPNKDMREVMARNIQLLFPMIALDVNNHAAWSPDSIDRWWQTENPNLSHDLKVKYAIRSFVIMESLGYRLPVSAWQPLSMKDIPSPDPLSPLASLLSRLDKAAQEKKIGETVLLAMVVLGEEGPGTAHAYTVARVVRSLRRVGLNDAAADIATEAAYLYNPGVE